MDVYVTYKEKKELFSIQKNKIQIGRRVIIINKNLKIKYRFFNNIAKGLYLNGEYFTFLNNSEVKQIHDILSELINTSE